MAGLSRTGSLASRGDENAVWLPLLLPVLFWSLVLAWWYVDPFRAGISPRLWIFLSCGSAGYLAALVGFAFLGNRDRPADTSTRIVTGLALGAMVALALFVASEWSGERPASGIAQANAGTIVSTVSDDSLNPLNALAAVLAVILAVMTLIAQKSATDARAEAERARNDILEAMDVRLLADASRLLQLAQEAKSGAEEFLTNANEVAPQDEQIARVLNLAAFALERLAKFSTALHKWTLEPHLTQASDLVGKVATLRLDIKAFDDALNVSG